MSENYDGKLPNGWQGGEPVTKWWRGSFVHLYRLRKNCAQCQQELVIDVTKAALTGEAKNAGLQLQRCFDCRSAAKASRSALRPHGKAKLTAERVPEAAVATGTDAEELERLQVQDARVYDVLKLVQAVMPATTLTNLTEAVRVMIEGASTVHAKYAEVFEENSRLKAKLATMSGQGKMPWEAP